MIVIAFDPGFVRCGYCIVELSDDADENTTEPGTCLNMRPISIIASGVLDFSTYYDDEKTKLPRNVTLADLASNTIKKLNNLCDQHLTPPADITVAIEVQPKKGIPSIIHAIETIICSWATTRTELIDRVFNIDPKKKSDGYVIRTSKKRLTYKERKRQYRLLAAELVDTWGCSTYNVTEKPQDEIDAFLVAVSGCRKMIN
jgi:hypothetical protein